MSLHQISQMKLDQFREDMKNEKNMEKKLSYLIKNEFDITLNDILQLEPDSYIDRIERGISFSLENIYTEECLSDQKLISIIDKLINNIKIEYAKTVQLLKDTWNNYEKILKRKPHKECLLSNFRKHCFNTDNLAMHNCGSNNSFFLIVKNKENKISYVICESCKKVYYSSYISCKCNHCNVDYYSGILTDEENPNYLVATWEKYHCPQMINEKMRCLKCRQLFYLDMKTGNLTCLNHKCGFISKPSRILWICSFCREEFNSNAIPYNPLSMKFVKKAIKQTLLLKHRAHPNKMPCCNLNVFFTEFFHKKTCRGILYEGELNDNMIVVCEKCQAINFYERFIWTCPHCLKKFKDGKYNDNYNDRNLNNDNIENKSSKDIHIQNNNELFKRKDKSRSVCKDGISNRYNERYNNLVLKEKNNKNINLEVKKEKNINREDMVKNFIENCDEKKEIKKYDLKLRYDSPSRNFYRLEEKSSKLNPRIDSQKDRCFKIILKNDVIQSYSDNKNIRKSQNNLCVYNNNLASKSSSGYKNEPKKLLISDKINEFQPEPGAKNIKNNEEKKQNYDQNDPLGRKRSNTANENNPQRDSNRRYYFNNRFKEENKKKENNEKENLQKVLKDDFDKSKNNLLKSEEKPRKDRFLRRNISVGYLNPKRQEIPKNSVDNFNKDAYNKCLDSPRKQYKKERFSSVEYKRANEKKEVEEIKNKVIINEINNYKILPYNRKLSSNFENIASNHRKNKIRFHASLSQTKEDNKEEIKEDIQPIKYRRFIINNIKNEENKIINNKIEEDEENKNTKDNSNQVSKEIEKKKNYRRFYINNNENNNEQNKEKNVELKDEFRKSNRNSNAITKENEEDICRFIPEKVGLQNLVGLTDKLLTHLKRRINNIFAKTKIPIFNIEDYKIQKKLGEGSYGIIYSVIKTDQKTPIYALKKIIARSITEVCSFIKEFELVYSCNHPNIMKIYGLCLRILDSTTFSIYVLMEKSKYDWDKEIKSHLSKRKIYSEKDLINILKQLTEALLFLKMNLNISHRDIKPQNILVFDDEKYKLADFGEAKEIKISKKLNTLRGTELYMSPALYEGLKKDKNDVSHDTFKSDVFSLGFCFLYAAGLNYNLLYQVRDITDNKITENAITNHLKKKYSDNFIQIICKMLKIDEIQRFGFSEILEYIKNIYG